MAGEGKLRHKRSGWMQAIRRGDRGKNLVFFDDMSPLQHREIFSFPVQRGIPIDELVRSLIALGKLQLEEGKWYSRSWPGIQTNPRTYEGGGR